VQSEQERLLVEAYGRTVRARPMLGYPVDVFVVAFSTLDDDLSQWRAYGSGGGYCLGFRRSYLQQCVINSDFSFVECTYDRAEQQRQLESVVRTLLGKL